LLEDLNKKKQLKI